MALWLLVLLGTWYMSCHEAIVVITGSIYGYIVFMITHRLRICEIWTLCVLCVEDHLKISVVVVYNEDHIYEANSFVAVRHYHEDNRSILTWKFEWFFRCLFFFTFLSKQMNFCVVLSFLGQYSLPIPPKNLVPWCVQWFGKVTLVWNGLRKVQIPAGNYMFKANNTNTRARCEICSKLIIKRLERRQ